jgi:2-aminoethylphosphonate-pyruvate transaminase
MGWREYLAPEDQGYIITSFYYPADPNFEFETFYQVLNQKGFVIYPGKISNAECFRIGHIGRLDPDDMASLLEAIRETLAEMNVELRPRKRGEKLWNLSSDEATTVH